MNQRIFAFTLGTMLFAFCVCAQAQQPKKVARIGLLSAGSRSTSASRIESFRQGLRDLGYVEGQNIIIEFRYTEGDAKRFPGLAAEVIGLKPDVIVTSSGAGAFAAKSATKTIPIVFTSVGDPFENGLVTSLSHPGGNITGLTNLSPDLNGKRLELLKERFPTLIRVAYLWNPDRPGTGLKDVQNAGRTMGLQLQSLEVRSGADFDRAFETALSERSQALMTLANPLFNTHQNQIIEFATKNRLPAIFHAKEFVDAGGLMSYAPDFLATYRRAATYVDKILKGTKPGDIPVEQPRKFEFVINLKTAQQIGLTVPPNVLARADRLIK
jgi:putative tryptophan/tyrosine transport system substrate-binding protein